MYIGNFEESKILPTQGNYKLFRNIKHLEEFENINWPLRGGKVVRANTLLAVSSLKLRSRNSLRQWAQTRVTGQEVISSRGKPAFWYHPHTTLPGWLSPLSQAQGAVPFFAAFCPTKEAFSVFSPLGLYYYRNRV